MFIASYFFCVNFYFGLFFFFFLEFVLQLINSSAIFKKQGLPIYLNSYKQSN